MKKITIEIGGIERPLCYSARVVKSIIEKYGSLDEFNKALFPEDIMTSLPARVWLLAQELDAGARYARLNGEDAPPVISEDDLLDLTEGNRSAELMNAAILALTAGTETSVEAKPAKKNVEATQDA